MLSVVGFFPIFHDKKMSFLMSKNAFEFTGLGLGLFNH